MDWKTMLAYVTGSVDEELLRRNEYLAAQRREPELLPVSWDFTAVMPKRGADR